MKKMNMSDDSTISKTSTELIVYQLGEVKNLITTLSGKVDVNQEKVEHRVSALEIWRAGEEERVRLNPKPLDVQKIILATLGIASAAIALALALVQSGIVK